jgi:Cu-Zn family superoxide dismutase
MNRTSLLVSLGVLLGAGLVASAAPAPVAKAAAVLTPLGGSGVSGVVTFTKVADGVKVEARISGLTPGAHGFHIHEFGDCSAPDGTSTGGHFNPTGAPHAGPNDMPRHAGDMGNVTAGEDGVATFEYVDDQIAFEGPHGILGRGLIVHAKADDLKTQPTGNAGGRVACGVIGVAKGE